MFNVDLLRQKVGEMLSLKMAATFRHFHFTFNH